MTLAVTKQSAAASSLAFPALDQLQSRRVNWGLWHGCCQGQVSPQRSHRNWGQPPPHPGLCLAFIPVYTPWDPRGAEECVRKFLCSDFPALPLAVSGSSRGAGAQGTSRAAGQLTALPRTFPLPSLVPLLPAQLRARWK